MEGLVTAGVNPASDSTWSSQESGAATFLLVQLKMGRRDVRVAR